MVYCDGAATEGTVYVALGKSVKKGKMILNWVLKILRGREIVILHVHRPPKLIPMEMGGWFPITAASPDEARRYIAKKRAEMNDILRTYLNFCAKEKTHAQKLVMETDDIYRGIVHLAGQHQIKNIVLGLRSMKEKPIMEKGLLSCQIWLISNGKLAFSRSPQLPPIIEELNQRSSTSSSYDAGGSSDYRADTNI
ncbi:U-box domain-containing protein 33-like isoform X2 [Wolffia australiana]